MAKASGKADSRKSLVMDRTALANERTILAYVRTALALVAAGASAIVFFESILLDALGGVFLLSGGVCMVVGVRSYCRMKRRLRAREAGAAESGGETGSER